MESQPQNPEFRNNLENFHPCDKYIPKSHLLVHFFLFILILHLLHKCKSSSTSLLFICALWSPAGRGLTSWLLFVVSNCEFCHFPIGILGQVWYLIVSIPDLCTLTYFANAIVTRIP